MADSSTAKFIADKTIAVAVYILSKQITLIIFFNCFYSLLPSR